MKEIYCLFSIENEYNQPRHNLVAWWSERPSHGTIKNLIKVDDVIAGKIYRGLAVADTYNTEYRLEKVIENKILN